MTGKALATTLFRRMYTTARALTAQVRAPVAPVVESHDLRPCAAALERVGARAAVVRVDARKEPCTHAGIQTAEGAPITWLAHGDSWVLSRRGIHFDAAMQIRVRTGFAAPALDGTGATHTASAPHAGPIEICSLYPGEFAGPAESVV